MITGDGGGQKRTNPAYKGADVSNVVIQIYIYGGYNMLHYIGINRTEAPLQAYAKKDESGLSAAISAENDHRAAAWGFLELDCLDSAPFATRIPSRAGR